MKKLFEEFETPSIEKWKELLAKELKSSNIKDPLFRYDEVEEIEVTGSYYSENKNYSIQKKKSNDWQIGSIITVLNSQDANKKALNLLNLGANTLNFDLRNTNDLNLSELLADIGIEYIHLYFTTTNNQKQLVSEWFSDKSPLFLQINSDNNYVNAYDIYAIGANATLELAYALAKGKELLSKTPNETIHFTFGIGANFLVEIAKFRTFLLLWNKIQTAYDTTQKTIITAQTGFINKSLQDPYTNLLRQTTEALSAVLGGVDQLIIQPYDTLSENESSEFTERMSINISHILKEESELNTLIDPMEGSLAIENYTNKLCDNSWKLFQEIEKRGGVMTDTTNEFLKSEIERIKTKRMELVSSNLQTLVGINKFPNPEASDLNWKNNVGGFMGIENLILERNFDYAQSDKIV
jgi:methylmalonyl-CoA mutase